MVLRILASFILIFSILFMPFWVSAVLAFGAMVYFNIYWEAALLFLLSDLLYGVKEAKFSGTVFISFVVVIMVLLIIEVVKKKLKFYPSHA